MSKIEDFIFTTIPENKDSPIDKFYKEANQPRFMRIGYLKANIKKDLFEYNFAGIIIKTINKLIAVICFFSLLTNDITAPFENKYITGYSKDYFIPTASSSQPGCEPWKSSYFKFEDTDNINGCYAWCAEVNDKEPWIQIASRDVE